MKYLKLFERFNIPDSELYRKIDKSTEREVYQEPNDKFNSTDRKIILRYLGRPKDYPSAEEMADKVLRRTFGIGHFSQKEQSVIDGILNGKTLEEYRQDKITHFQQWIDGVYWFTNTSEGSVRRIIKLMDSYYIVVLNQEEEVNFNRDYVTYKCDGYDGLKALLKAL